MARGYNAGESRNSSRSKDVRDEISNLRSQYEEGQLGDGKVPSNKRLQELAEAAVESTKGMKDKDEIAYTRQELYESEVEAQQADESRGYAAGEAKGSTYGNKVDAKWISTTADVMGYNKVPKKDMADVIKETEKRFANFAKAVKESGAPSFVGTKLDLNNKELADSYRNDVLAQVLSEREDNLLKERVSDMRENIKDQLAAGMLGKKGIGVKYLNEVAAGAVEAASKGKTKDAKDAIAQRYIEDNIILRGTEYAAGENNPNEREQARARDAERQKLSDAINIARTDLLNSHRYGTITDQNKAAENYSKSTEEFDKWNKSRNK